MQGLGEAILITWARYGLRIEKQNESVDCLEIYISVPEHSYATNAYGQEMAGLTLARRFKKALTEMGVKRLVVKSRVRTGEVWLEPMANEAETQMRQTIYGSQW